MGTYNTIRQYKFINKLLGILLCISIVINIYFFIKCNTSKETVTDSFIPIDTTYNKIILDSIEYNISIRDSIIYKYKKQIVDDEKQINSLSDSATIKLFFEYTRGTKSY